jgi:MHS family proline/betaine transporter-like MFS transporter
VVPTFVMGLLPTYAQIGIAAPIILIAMRFIQGLSVGGEYTTSMVLLVEDSRPNRRGHLGSYANFGAIGGMLLGSAVGATLLGLLPPEAAASWGWRFAFLSGLLIGIVVFAIRRRLPADEIIVAHEADRKSPLLEAFRTQWSTMLRMIAVMFASNVGFYLCFIYLSTWLQQNDHLPASTTLLMNCIALGTLMAVTPWFGGLSDRFGRKPILLIGGLSLALLAIPVFHILGTGQILPIVIAQCVLALALCAANTSSAFLVEAFPKHVRCSALAISYNFSAAAFGGTAPLVAVYLTKTLSTPIAPAFYLLGAAIVSIAALMISRSEYVPGQA